MPGCQSFKKCLSDSPDPLPRLKTQAQVIPLNCNDLRFQEEQILEGETLQITTVSEGEPSNDHLEEDS